MGSILEKVGLKKSAASQRTPPPAADSEPSDVQKLIAERKVAGIEAEKAARAMVAAVQRCRELGMEAFNTAQAHGLVGGLQIFDFKADRDSIVTAMVQFLGELGFGLRAPFGCTKTFSEAIDESNTMLEQEMARSADRLAEKAV